MAAQITHMDGPPITNHPPPTAGTLAAWEPESSGHQVAPGSGQDRSGSPERAGAVKIREIPEDPPQVENEHPEIEANGTR